MLTVLEMEIPSQKQERRRLGLQQVKIENQLGVTMKTMHQMAVFMESFIIGMRQLTQGESVLQAGIYQAIKNGQL